MKRAYDVRSSIVHGGTPSLHSRGGTAISLEDFTNSIGGYLRRSLCKFLELAQQGETPSHLVEWDTLLFPEMS
jgi:hypothetical protein